MKKSALNYNVLGKALNGFHIDKGRPKPALANHIQAKFTKVRYLCVSHHMICKPRYKYVGLPVNYGFLGRAMPPILPPGQYVSHTYKEGVRFDVKGLGLQGADLEGDL